MTTINVTQYRSPNYVVAVQGAPTWNKTVRATWFGAIRRNQAVANVAKMLTYTKGQASW